MRNPLLAEQRLGTDPAHQVLVGWHLDQIDERDAPRLRERGVHVASRYAELALHQRSESASLFLHSLQGERELFTGDRAARDQRVAEQRAVRSW